MTKIYTKVVSVWCEKRQRYVTESAEYFDHNGPIAECKGFFSSKKAPPPPPPPAPKTVQDLINGVETVTEMRDGKEYVITRQLPLTPEQQAFKDDITKRLDNIDKLSQGIAVLNPDYAPMVNALRSWQQQTRGQLFGEATRSMQDELTRRGLGNSTAAANSALQLGRQMGEQVQQDELNLFGLAEQQRATELGNLRTNLGLRSDLSQQNLQNLNVAGQNTANQQSNRLSLDSQIQQQNYANQLTAFNSQRPSLGSQLLSTAAQLGGAYLTGGYSLPFGIGAGKAASSVATPQGGMFNLPGGTKLNSKLGF